MDDFDPDGLGAKVEKMPLDRLNEALELLAGLVDQLGRWADRLLGGVRGGRGDGGKRAGRS